MRKLLQFVTITTTSALLAASPLWAEDEKPKAAEPGGAAAAGEGRAGGGQRNPEARLNRMSEMLTLTEEQKGKIKEIFAKNRDKNAEAMAKLRDDKSLTPEQRREKFQEITKAESDEINAVLTPEQQAKWKEAREKQRERGAGRQRRGEAGAGGAKPDGGDKKEEQK